MHYLLDENGKLKLMLATVVDDIDFGVRSPMFEFTVIADGSEDAGAAKLAKAAAYVFAPY